MELADGMAAVVTGGASGLGKASAQALADAGLKVTIFDVNEKTGEEHAEAIGGSFVLVDITDEQKAAEEAKKQEQQTLSQWWVSLLIGIAIIAIIVSVIIVTKFTRAMKMK